MFFLMRSMEPRNNHRINTVDIKRMSKVYYGLGGKVIALNEIDLKINQGELFIVMGKSGSGKTTLINMITGLDRCTAGEIWVAESAVHKMSLEQSARWRGKTIGVVFQSFELMPGLTLLQNVMLPMDFGRCYPIPQQSKRAMGLLDQMGIADHAHKLPSAISGGQQQRVAIARAMANDPPIIAADEPTGSLDSASASAVMRVFRELTLQGKTVIVVTHDREIAKLADRMITLSDGEIIH